MSAQAECTATTSIQGRAQKLLLLQTREAKSQTQSLDVAKTKESSFITKASGR